MSAKTHDSVTISWDKYKDGMEDIQFSKYTIEVKRTINKDTVTLESQVNNHVITDLDPGVSYQISVQVATVDFGKSEWSDVLPVKTKTLSESDLSEIEQLNEDIVRHKFLQQIIFESIFYALRYSHLFYFLLFRNATKRR